VGSATPGDYPEDAAAVKRAPFDRDAAPSVAFLSLLPALTFLLPFEPRRGLALAGMRVTALEAAAALAMLALLWSGRASLRALAQRPPLPLVFLAAYAVAHLASAACAEDNPALALKFALRMTAAAVFAWLVAAAPASERRSALLALLASSVLAAVLCVLEACGVRAVDPLLDLFRGSISHVGGVRRATGGSESPTLAAAFLMIGLVLCAGLGGKRWRGLPAWAVLAPLLALGLLFTYARGPLLAAVAGLLVVAGLTRRRGEADAARASRATLLILIAMTLAFLAASPILGLRLAGSGARAFYGVGYEPGDATLALRAAESRDLSLRVTNAGERAWIPGLRLCARWFDVDRKRLDPGPCAELPKGVLPGAGVPVQIGIEAPAREGRYFLVWDVLQEGSAWLSLRGVAPALVPVSVRGGLESAAPGWPGPEDRPNVGELSASWPQELASLERTELWRLALAMWKDHPWLGVGPDNFRWLQGRYSGHAFPQTWVFSNNTFLEAAATVGSLGFLALVGTLVATAARAAGAARTAPVGSEEGAQAIVGLALTACLVVHGCVDYVLAFTGHSLFLGLLVGLVASLRSGAS
jgi:O-antigen ligase